MFQVKICGITTVDDARSARDAGADAIGLNFYPPSPRCIARDLAERIVAAVADQVAVVGVFVNAPILEMTELADKLPLHFIQLHGDEPAECLADLSPRRVIRAFRLRKGGESSVCDYLASCGRLSTLPSAILLDAYQQGKYGGTGSLVDVKAVGRLGCLGGGVLTVLAGGLTPENVERMIRETRPDAVDVAGGVESSPGRKDRHKMQSFVAAAKRAFTGA